VNSRAAWLTKAERERNLRRLFLRAVTYTHTSRASPMIPVMVKVHTYWLWEAGTKTASLMLSFPVPLGEPTTRSATGPALWRLIIADHPWRRQLKVLLLF
jgi:hypothetical protein